MRRREFITLVGGAAISLPFSARAQQSVLPVVGLLSRRSAADSQANIASFRRGLSDFGYVEGRNVRVEYRWANGDSERLQPLVSELAALPVKVLAAGSVEVALAAKAVTSTIPVVFITSGDPVKLGLVHALNRSGTNFVAMTFLANVIVTKQVEVLHRLIPEAKIVGLLVNPVNSISESIITDTRAAAEAMGLKPLVARAKHESEFSVGFSFLAQQGCGALLVANDSFFDSRAKQIVAQAAYYSIPTMYSLRDYVQAGGLVSYGASLKSVFRKMGNNIAKILDGADPAEMPSEQSTTFSLVINAKTATALRLKLDPSALALADEVIE